MAGIDLSALPAPAVVEALDYEAILAELVADYRLRWPEHSAWVESDPALKIFEAAAYREYLVRARVNDAARSVMLAHAEGADLDQLAALFAVARLAGESDGGLRRRVLLSLGAHNTAGSAAGYEYWARSAGAALVCAVRQAPGTVRVVVGGEVAGEGAAALDAQPSKALYDDVVAVFARDDVRPVTDTVVVQALRVHPYRVQASLEVDAGADAAAVRAAAEASCRAYCLARHRCAPPDNTVHRSALIHSLFVAGVASVVLALPAADVDPDDHEAPWPTAQTAADYGAAVPAADPVRQPMDGVAVTVA